jgi:ATP-binding cassette subfamily B protein
MKLLFTYLKPYKWLIVIVLLLSSMSIIFSLIDPIIFGKIVNLAADYRSGSGNFTEHDFLYSMDKEHPGVMYYILVVIAVAMGARLAKNFQDYVMSIITQKYGAKIFTDGLKHAMSLPYQEFEDQRSGETLSVLKNVREDTVKFISNFVNILFPVFVGIIMVAVFAYQRHWSLPIIYFGGIAVLLVVSGILSKKIKTIQKNIVTESNILAGATTESLRNIELVKSLGLTSQEVDRLNSNTYKILGLELKKVKNIRSISFLQGTFVNALRQGILFLLLWLVYREQLDAGELVTMQVFSFFLFGPLQDIGNIILSYRESQAALQNFKDLMAKKPEANPITPLHIEHLDTLRFEKVSFQHRSAKQKAVDNIDFTLKRGETIAFVGPSGAGKSTMMKLLIGLYPPLEGEIYYNEIPFHKITLDSIRNQIGFVSQDTQLFSGTIRENLLFVKPSATDEELMRVLEKAACQSILNKASDGLESKIGEGGLKLSGGEKQRLSIARALLRNPSILLFDEATSALDSITELDITTTIKDIAKERTRITVIIAHRLSTIMHVDRIYVLEQGKIIETGNHEELLEEKGLYYAMWRQQIGERSKNLI